MPERKFQDKKRYLWALIIGTIIFLLVFLISNGISFLEFQRISNLQDSIAYKIFEDKLSVSFFNQPVCANESFNKISQDLGFQGKIINDLETKFGKNNEQVLQRKKFYSLIELEHFEFVKSRIENCGLSTNTILFFYSNEDKEIEQSKDVGKLLDEVYSRNNNIVIYSFDINLNSSLIKDLVEKYKVKSSPSLIINENSTIIEPIRIENVEKFLI